jgi:hypothetical protein
MLTRVTSDGKSIRLMNNYDHALIRHTLGNSPIPFVYSEDQFAIDLLRKFIGPDYKLVREIKKSQFSPLLSYPVMREILAKAGTGRINQAALNSWAPNPPKTYRITLGRWGTYRNCWKEKQTTRHGYNLVMQINFPIEHDRMYRRLLNPVDNYAFAHKWHPITTAGLITMAWVRIDLSFDTGETLIEEIQSDWIRRASCLAGCSFYEGDEWKNIQELDKPVKFNNLGLNTDTHRMQTYAQLIQSEYEKIWQEVTLSAAVWFLSDEIGLKHLYYHTPESGAWLKGVTYSSPPHSIYSNLPRRFCFRPTSWTPEFLSDSISMRCKSEPVHPPLSFWKLELP